MNAAAPIGVFDSGVGGLSVLRALRAALPAEDFVYLADSAHAPYGERDDAFVAARAMAMAAQLHADHGIKALVVACNTATAAAMVALRDAWPAMPLVGVEPALKPAAARTRTGAVGVMATRSTLASRKFAALHASLAGQARFFLQPCDGLADAIEQQDATKIIALCAEYTRALGRFGSTPGAVDTLVLGCTHYPFAADVLRGLASPVRVKMLKVELMETGEPVARQTGRLLAAAGLQAARASGGLTLRSTGSPAALDALRASAARWLPQPVQA